MVKGWKHARGWLALSAMALLLTVLLAAVMVLTATAQDAPETPLSGSITYRVQVGDVLERIAAFYDVSVACIVEVNALPRNGNLLFPGDEIVISAECPPYEGNLPVENPRDFGTGGGGGASEYTVRGGDTLDRIAQGFNISVVSLQLVNGLDAGARIAIGDVLTLPTDGVPYGFYPGIVSGSTTGVDFYIMQPLDVLDLVAAYYDVDLPCLAAFNGVEDVTLIEPGFIVGIPADCPPYSGLSTAPATLRGLGIRGVVTGSDAPAAAQPTAQASGGIDSVVGSSVGSPGTSPAAPTPIAPTPTSTPLPAVIIETPVGGGNTSRPPTVTPTPGG
ncbi:MAG: LysM domain-containing protein [bacterium]|nr:LysM domain-containing protein [bacterium]